MGATSCWVVVLAVVMGAAAVLAAIPGPKNPRYPDNIVEPRVSCVKEGVFPHPRNCNWYYRCVDRMSIGYYWTYYFECEPGTVFSDELDQCVHPFLAEPPCGGKVTPKPIETTPSPPFIPCHGIVETCKTYDICEPVKQTKYMCDKIRCPLRTPELSCADGYSFDMDIRECAKTPEASSLCGALTQINITEAGQLPCSADNMRPASEFITRLYCDTYVLCAGNQFQGQKSLCRNYYECERVGNSWTAYLRACPAGLLYSYAEDRCEVTPTVADLCTDNQLFT